MFAYITIFPFVASSVNLYSAVGLLAIAYLLPCPGDLKDVNETVELLLISKMGNEIKTEEYSILKQQLFLPRKYHCLKIITQIHKPTLKLSQTWFKSCMECLFSESDSSLSFVLDSMKTLHSTDPDKITQIIDFTVQVLQDNWQQQGIFYPIYKSLLNFVIQIQYKDHFIHIFKVVLKWSESRPELMNTLMNLLCKFGLSGYDDMLIEILLFGPEIELNVKERNFDVVLGDKLKGMGLIDDVKDQVLTSNDIELMKGYFL